MTMGIHGEPPTADVAHFAHEPDFGSPSPRGEGWGEGRAGRSTTSACRLQIDLREKNRTHEVHSFHPILGDFNRTPLPHDLKILTREKKQKNPLTLTLRDA
jgi:hypothetical protein